MTTVILLVARESSKTTAENCKQYLFVVNIAASVDAVVVVVAFCGCNREKLFTCYAILCG